MPVKQLSYSLLCILLFSSCRQFKALTAKDHSASVSPSPKTGNKKVRFLDNISLTPQVVTSKHVTTVPDQVKTKIKKGTSINVPERAIWPSGNIERADWLQLKYAIVLDANVEKVTNINLFQLIDEWWGTSYCIGGSI